MVLLRKHEVSALYSYFSLLCLKFKWFTSINYIKEEISVLISNSRAFFSG